MSPTGTIRARPMKIVKTTRAGGKPRESSTFQSKAGAHREDFLHRVLKVHWPKKKPPPSGPIITVGWEWRYEFAFTGGNFFAPANPSAPFCGDFNGSFPCFDHIMPDSANGFFCGWGDFTKVGTDLGGIPPAKVGPSIDAAIFDTGGSPTADEDISLPPHVYASQAWTQPMIAGAQFASNFVPQFPLQPELGGAFVYSGTTSAGGAQALWGKPIKDFGIGYWLTQSTADRNLSDGACVFHGGYANGWTTIGPADIGPLGGAVSASITGNKFATLQPPGTLEAPTTIPIAYELYQAKVAFSINDTTRATTGSVGVIDFTLNYKVKGTPTPPLG